MINIAHPPVSSKPPLNKFCPSRSVIKKLATRCNDGTRSSSNETISDKYGSHNLPGQKILSCDKDARERESKVEKSSSDCNQNVIEPNSCSFEQLCSMISDLEKNIAIEGTAADKADFSSMDLGFSSQRYLNQDQPEKDSSKNICISNGSTYEDIMSFLGTLEQDNAISEFSTTNNICRRSETKPQNTETLREDLETALLKLEDREATLKMLKNEMTNERKMACEKMEKQKKESCAEIQSQKIKYQGVVRRHQKFIEQLIAEKKDLTEKCNSLAQRIREIETKQQRELKCAIERHAIELQRAKDICAASEKIRRERWLEAKTSKIKEMTVKGLEPELRSMVEQHQQEIQDIRSTHMKELQDVELRTIRRSNQQLEQLRLELTASHDKIVANEREALRVRFQEKFDEQEGLLQTQQRKFFEDLQKERKNYADEQVRRDEERDLIVKQTTLQFQEKIETLVRQNQIEKRNLEESLQSERETWIENYRRQQSSKFEIAQARIIDDCNRERDRQIELAIARLEKETRDMKSNLQKSWENKLLCTKEKYDSELQDANERLVSLEGKCLSSQQKLENLERHIEKTEQKLEQCMTDLSEAKQTVNRLTMERDQAKKIARQEIESEKRELEDKIASLYRELTQNNANRDSVMAQLYSRIKLIVTQKDLSIKNVTRESNELKEKCEHLEKMLDQQRKEYVLKSL